MMAQVIHMGNGLGFLPFFFFLYGCFIGDIITGQEVRAVPITLEMEGGGCTLTQEEPRIHHGPFPRQRGAGTPLSWHSVLPAASQASHTPAALPGRAGQGRNLKPNV